MEKIEFSDHGRILQVPLTTALIDFSCPKCGYQAPFHLTPDKSLSESFGICSRCTARMQPKDLVLDVGKLLALLKTEHGVTISFN